MDAATVFVSLILARQLVEAVELFETSGLAPLTTGTVLLYAAALAVVSIAIMTWQGVYQQSNDHMKLDSDRRFVRSLTMLVLFVFVPFFYLQGRTDTRELVTITAVLLPILLIMEKTLAVAFLSKRYDRPRRTRKLLILGSNHDASYVLRQALSCWSPGYLPVGFLAPEPVENGQMIESESRGLVGSAPVLGSYDQLEKTLKRHAVEEIWINDPELPKEQLVDILRLCDERGVVVSMLPSIGRIPTMAVTATYAGGQVLLQERKAVERIYYDRIKRLVDFVAASLLLTVLSPLLLLIAVWVKIDSPGPVLFSQDRVGKDGKLFKMFKFRSMYSDAPKYAISPKSRFDPRITKAGRILRKTSFDELPQLINVFRGEMSLVGPRPDQPFICEEYNRFQAARLQVKPGITGLWQISADRSVPIHENLDYDLYYIQNRSLTTDMVILWRTLWFALHGI